MMTGESRYGSGDVLAARGVRKDGSRVSLEFTVVLVPNDTSGLAGIAAVVRDVSQRFDETNELRARVAAQAKDPS
jgi:PAS domain S-box-containing protein